MGKIVSSLIIANVVVFLLVFSMPEALQEQAFGSLSFSRGQSLEAWRWFTSLFMHVSASHLFFNMLGLFFFGRILEEEVKRQWFLSIYFVAGLLGNLVFLFTSPAPVVGASGAMFGVLGAAMMLNPLKRIHIYLLPLPLGIIAIAFTIFEALIVYFQPQEFSNVANVSHVAGIMTGALFAFFYDPKKSVKGVAILVVSLILLIVLSPAFALIAGLGSIVWQVVDYGIGIVLYGLANLLSFIWG